jgi:hypothetical protein
VLVVSSTVAYAVTSSLSAITTPMVGTPGAVNAPDRCAVHGRTCLSNAVPTSTPAPAG